MKKTTPPPKNTQLNKPGEDEHTTAVLDGSSSGSGQLFTMLANGGQAVQAFNTLFDNHPIPMWVYDLKTLAFLAVNHAAVERYGYSTDEFLRMTIKDIRPESEIHRLVEDIAQDRSAWQRSGRWIHRLKNGTLINVEITSHTIDNNGSTTILVMAHDVTEHVKADEKIRQINRIYTILSEVNQTIVRVRDMTELYRCVCKLSVEKGAFALVWISLIDPQTCELRVAACSAETDDLLKKSQVQVGETPAKPGSIFRSYSFKEPLIGNDFHPVCASMELPEALCHSEIRSYAVFPLMIAGEVRGTLNLFSQKPDIFDQQEQELLKEMSLDISFALEHSEQQEKRRLAESNLLQKTEELDRYFTSSLDLLCIADTGGHFRRLNPEWEKTLGYPLDELEGKVFLDYVHPDDLPGTLDTISILSKQREVLNFENRYRCKDGTYRWIEWRSIPYGEIIYAVARDITEHKLAEEKLRQSQQQFATFMKFSPWAAFIKDHNRRYIYVSAEFEKEYGIPAADWIGHTFEELVPSLSNKQIQANDKVILSGGQPIVSEHNFHKNGKSRWLLINLFPMKDENGLIRIGGFSIDITERKQREREIEALYDLSTRLRAVQTPEEAISILVKTVRQVLEADSGQVILSDPERKHFIVAGVDGHVSNAPGYRFPINQGMSGWVWNTSQAYVTDDYASDPHHIQPLDEHDPTGPVIFTPLQSEKELMGVLLVSRLRSSPAHPFTQEDVRLLSAIGEMAGNTLRRMNLYTDALRRLKQLQALRNIDLAITGNLDLHITLDLLLDEVRSQLQVDAAGVLLLDEETENLKYEAGRGFRKKTIEKTRLHLGECYAGQAAIGREVISSHNLAEEENFIRKDLQKDEEFVVYFAAPMISKGKVLGILEIFHRSSHPTLEEWQELLLALAGRAAIAVDNYRLFTDLKHSNEELRQAYDATILGWSRAMDLRDEDTEGHTMRVTEMTVNLAREMGFSADEMIHIRRGALLHDMGKLGVPDSILRKPGPLTEEEWVIMRCHPLYTYDMLSPIEFLRPALDIPFYHHEKWDGSGYPSAMKGEAIPLAARIFSVIDVYDALTSDRPYRKAWTVQKALEHIQNSSGSHFDPQVVKMFMKMMQV
jgi:PAS domain S-box-containing protein